MTGVQTCALPISSTITSKTDVIYTENGFYDTKNDIGKLKGKSNINYNNKKIEGDLIDYDRKKNYSKAVNNVKITDTLNNMIARGHYAELYRNIRGTKNDSMFITKKALVSTLVDKKTNDSLHLHGIRYRDWETDRKSTRLNSSHLKLSRMPSSA